MTIATAKNKTNNHTSNTQVIKEKRVLKHNLDLLEELGKIKHVWVSYTIQHIILLILMILNDINIVKQSSNNEVNTMLDSRVTEV